MTDYTKLVNDLRDTERVCRNRMDGQVMLDAADVIEALQAKVDKQDAEITELLAVITKKDEEIEVLQAAWIKSETDATNLTGKLAQAEADIERLNLEIDKRIATEIELSNQVDALQAEVERLKDSNEELRERQTYIDHYGDTWMTSGKDVPTVAYKHGYADGWDEARAKMEAQE